MNYPQKTIRIALAQINTTVGDLPGNTDKIIHYIHRARHQNAELIVFPELTITGYPPEDLLLRKQFVLDNIHYLTKIIPETKDILAIVGFVHPENGAIYNAAAMLQNQKHVHTYHKTALPNYGVFDEKRYFATGNIAPVYELGNIRIGVNICEDIWVENSVAHTQAVCGNASIIINISASPFHAGKEHTRNDLLVRLSHQNRAFFVYVNLIGGQDELVFDGGSTIYNPHGTPIFSGERFQEQFACLDLEPARAIRARTNDEDWSRMQKLHCPQFSNRIIELPELHAIKKKHLAWPVSVQALTRQEIIYRALVLGLQDYVWKNGFNQVVLGLSGGIDSAMVTVIAADAIGANNITCVTMPSRYSSEGSVDDSRRLCQNLGISLITIPIEPAFTIFQEMLAPIFQNLPQDITEENLQARIRANLLMALSNKFNWLVLTTGNKSEVSVGYCTIYGDMAGGFSVLKDVPKTMVYQLAEFYNTRAGYDLVPRAIIEKVPSAELKPNQTDQDSLPPYDVLDQIIEAYIQDEKSAQEIIASGFNPEVVQKVIRMIDSSEYKRRQAAPGIKITPKAFGKDRRLPITNKYKFINFDQEMADC